MSDTAEKIIAELERTAREFRATSDEMYRIVSVREPHAFAADDVIRYGAFASAWESAARVARRETK